ncbi:MAG: 3-dehydroquinate synthase [Candidatus Bathyarchaeota archaeon]|mgnify:CR=1 FL=1|jgi:3-dehydroquinate synthase|nr:3-dehydroquinate synthase [Candidatus Bathyarchaeota archaeon]MDP7442886.1 3-dehydroquinate synthase [Candidatus Bathyarchaeota archaeon]|tara:strand:+ start:6335 stop:7450 length:1116 start_codon:yes stop_codon:yes gene_type:complete
MTLKGSGTGARTMDIHLEERSYTIYVGDGVIKISGRLIRERLPLVKTCAIVTSEGIPGDHVQALEAALKSAGFEAKLVNVPDGEKAKSWDVAGALLGELIDVGLDRRSAVIALGGGAIGDLVGFVAAIYMRGIHLVQAPTTLLAQVDSSYGGKTAVNHPKGKNLIGSFYQPSLVISDTRILKTLPRKELLSGLGEVVKHGVIADHELFRRLEAEGSRLLKADPDALSEVVVRSVAVKGKLIEEDEREKGARAILNYGHTAGHALEIQSEGGLRHGEAIALGMEVAAEIANGMDLLKAGDAERQHEVLCSLGFNLEPPKVTMEKIMAAMHKDKKAVGGTINFVLPTGIGSTPVLRSISDDLITDTMEMMGYE